ncbi:glycosyltransferase [Arcticibacter pallidicorallinus]|nr:glycosyltransferase [Arcticibacter pallidicorallinus]
MEKKILYGGVFPLYKEDGSFLIPTFWGIASYLFQKRALKKRDIPVRTKALVSYLRKEKVDVVLAEYGTTGAMVAEACKLADVPLVIHFHGADAHHHSTINEYQDWYRRAFQYASTIIGVSNDMINSLQRLGAPREKLVLNPYGINTERFAPAHENTNRSNSFLFVGRFVSKKSPQTTIKAFYEVLKRSPEARLIMAGGGPLLEESKTLTQELGIADKVNFPGVLPSDEISQLLKQSCCFVQHSVTPPDGDMEGTPNTILEAAAAALPVVSTRHAGIKEAVIEGKTGYLVDEYDTTGMAEKMVAILSSPEQAAEMGREGRKHIMQNYTLSDRIARLNAILEEAIAKKHNHS